MRVFYLVVLLGCYLSLQVDGQSTEEYFSMEDLSINAFHYNQYDGLYSRSYTFYRKSNYCGEKILEFINNENGHFRYLKIEDDKVFSFDTSQCEKTLIYDFAAEIDQVMDEGLYEGWRVTNKSD